MNSFLTGLATGLAIGYLTAPRSGKETRDQLTEAANRQTKGLKEQWDTISEQLTKLIDDLKTQSESAQSEPNLLANTEPYGLNQYNSEGQRTKGQVKKRYNNEVDSTADAAKIGVSRAADALEL